MPGKPIAENGFENLLEEYTSKLEQRVAEETQNFRMMADVVPQILWTTLADGTSEYFNSRWYEYTGADPSLGHNQMWNVTHPDDLPKVIEYWNKAISTGMPFQYEYRFRGRNGRYRWFLGRALPGRDSDGKITKWYGSCTDIDDHKKAQAKKDEFIAIASHELKTPVTSIKTFAQILERRAKKNGEAELGSMIGKMDIQINKLTSLIGDLLDISKIDSGKLVLNPEVFDFDEFTRTSVENLQLISDMHEIELVGSARHKVKADKNRIEQVLINFVSNAIKYSPEANTIRVHVASDDREAIISVEDFGVGIDPELHDLIFDRFYRISGPKSETFPGLGLGLFICKEIISREGGRIWVDSKPDNGGTIFSFALPVTEDEARK